MLINLFTDFTNLNTDYTDNNLPGLKPDISGHYPGKSFGKHLGNNNPYKSVLDPHNP
jgi:hypothetical protein